MRNQLFYLNPRSRENLQLQIRELLVNAILNGQLPRASPIPSCRELAHQLGVSRNTVVLAYSRLVEDGFLLSQERSGYYVSSELPPKLTGHTVKVASDPGLEEQWEARLRVFPSQQRNISKPVDWSRFPFPFVYGQPDLNLFPFEKWRECARDATSEHSIRSWACDMIDHDDALLVKELQSTVLPRRGLWAQADEILITMGTQHALYMISELLMGPGVTVGIEDPGYVDARNIFRSSGARVIGLPVDVDGLIVNDRLRDCDFIYVTPSHQAPTTVTMSLARRRKLLELANDADLIVIEDDYDGETNFVSEPTPALKSLDRYGRVLYVSSLSKSLLPGLRLGYLVAPARVIREARAQRRLMIRHPPISVQAAAALFLVRGYHDMLIRKLWTVYRTRWELMRNALQRYLPNMSHFPTLGGTSFWMEGPRELHCVELAADAAEDGILLEPGDVHFVAVDPPMQCFRLGFSAAPESCIEEGIKRLAAVVHRHLRQRGGQDSGSIPNKVVPLFQTRI